MIAKGGMPNDNTLKPKPRAEGTRTPRAGGRVESRVSYSSFFPGTDSAKHLFSSTNHLRPSCILVWSTSVLRLGVHSTLVSKRLQADSITLFVTRNLYIARSRPYQTASL